MRMKQNQLSKFKWNSTLPKRYVTCSPFSLVAFQSHPSLCPRRVIPFVPGASLLQLFTCRFGFFSPGPFPSESSRLMGSLLHIVKQSLDFRSSSGYFPPLCASLPTRAPAKISVFTVPTLSFHTLPFACSSRGSSLRPTTRAIICSSLAWGARCIHTGVDSGGSAWHAAFEGRIRLRTDVMTETLSLTFVSAHLFLFFFSSKPWSLAERVADGN